jgi:hypothetical protein
MRRGHANLWLLALVGTLCIPAAALAQDARVVTASSSGRILELSFDPEGSSVLNTDAASRVKLVSLVFRDDGADGVHLLAADRQRGQVLFYSGAAGDGAIVLDAVQPGHPRFPDGLSLSANDDLFGTTSAKGGARDKDALVWVLRRDPACAGGCLAGDYAPAVGTIDGDVEITVMISGAPTVLQVELLGETRVVPFDRGVLDAGDLLVLASDPPALLRYPAAAVAAFLDELARGGTPAELEPEVVVFPSNADAPPERRFPAGAEPHGMDFTPQGNLLVTSGNGTVLVYRPDGTRFSDGSGFVDFATGLGHGKFKLVVGPQDGSFRAFVADRNGGEVLRFLIEPDGTGTLDGIVDDTEFPVGITTTTANTVPVQTGAGVTIQPTNLMRTTIEEVVFPGATGVSVFLFEDPRESEVATPPDQPLHRALLLGEILAELPPDAEIPAYVRAFRKGDPVLGPPTFLLIVADSNVDVFGVLLHVIEEGLILGYEPDCDDADSSAQPRLFWGPSPGEAPILESPVFTDVSNDCGTTRGISRSWSLFLASARDTRPTLEIAHSKLAALRRVLADAECVDFALVRKLDRLLGSAQLEFARGGYAAAREELQAFSALVQASPGAFASCTVNLSGELRARADSTIFMLQKLP